MRVYSCSGRRWGAQADKPEVEKMKKMFLGMLLVTGGLFFTVPPTVGAEVSISVSLPLIAFSGQPAMVVLPETDIYVVPEVDADLYFFDGWWWRPWQGRWYRSHRYDAGWEFYGSVPSFYGNVYSGWRNDYRDHRWQGQAWNYQRLSHRQVQNNWNGWRQNRHWEKQNSWGVPGLKSRPAAPPAVHAVPQTHAVQPRAPQPSRLFPQSQGAQPARAVRAVHEVPPPQNVQPARGPQPAQAGQSGRAPQPGGGDKPRTNGQSHGGREHGGR
jgi:hypothetical protein